MKKDLIDILTPGVITEINLSWPWWILQQTIKVIFISPRLLCPCFQQSGDRAVHSYCSKSIDISSCIHNHPGMPGYKKTQSPAHVSDLTSDKFWLLLAIVKNRLMPRNRSQVITKLHQKRILFSIAEIKKVWDSFYLAESYIFRLRIIKIINIVFSSSHTVIHFVIKRRSSRIFRSYSGHNRHGISGVETSVIWKLDVTR